MPSSKHQSSKNQDAGFKLPPGITFERRDTADAVAYVFRHDALGEHGRLVVREHGPAQCLISSEVFGDPQDPMTVKRREILEPITLRLSDLMNQRIGGQGRVLPAGAMPASSPEPAGMGES